jgi:hypothetical protein
MISYQKKSRPKKWRRLFTYLVRKFTVYGTRLKFLHMGAGAFVVFITQEKTRWIYGK